MKEKRRIGKSNSRGKVKRSAKRQAACLVVAAAVVVAAVVVRPAEVSAVNQVTNASMPITKMVYTRYGTQLTRSTLGYTLIENNSVMASGDVFVARFVDYDGNYLTEEARFTSTGTISPKSIGTISVGTYMYVCAKIESSTLDSKTFKFSAYV